MIGRYFRGARAFWGQNSSSLTSRRTAAKRRPLFETLELRQMLANYTWSDANDTLLISLANNESLTVTESSGNVSFQLSSGVFAQSGGDGAPGNGTGTITLAATDLVSSVTINNSDVTTGTNDVTFSAAGSLSSGAINVGLIDPDAVGTISAIGFHLASTGVGGMTLESRRNIVIRDNATLITTSGDITLRANQQPIAMSGQFDGIYIYLAEVTTTGTGNILMEGRGGDESFPNMGINVSASKIESTATGPSAGTITLDGRGGLASNSSYGFFLDGLVTSVDGDITITGHGGGNGTGSNCDGIFVWGTLNAPIISSTGQGSDAAKITLNGFGGKGAASNDGLTLIDARITSMDGDIKITGKAGSGIDSFAIHFLGFRMITSGNGELCLVEIPPPVLLEARDAFGVSGVKIPLDIEASGTDDQVVVSIIISGVPQGATFWRGDIPTGEALGNGSWQFAVAQLRNLAIRLPAGHEGNVRLIVTARYVDTNSSESDEVSDRLTVFVSQVKNVVALGTESGSQPWVQVIDKTTGNVVSKFLAYDASFTGGVRVAMGDMTGDGLPEIVTAQGAGDRNVVRVFTLDGVELKAFRTAAYSTNGFNGVNVAVGDVNGDGRNDIVVAPSQGKAEVRVFRNEFIIGQNPRSPSNDPIGAPWKRFLAFSGSFKGGAVVAVADMKTIGGIGKSANTLDGRAEIIVGSGAGMRATVRVFSVQSTKASLVQSIVAFSNSFKGGIASIDVGRINRDLIPDIVVGAGQGFGSMVRVFDGRTGALINSFRAYEGGSRQAAVRATLMDSNNDGIVDQIVTAQGPGGTTRALRSFAPLTGALVDEIIEDDVDFSGEYWIGA